MRGLRISAIATLIAIILIDLLQANNANGEVNQEKISSEHHLGVLLGGGIGSYREDLVVPISFDGPAFTLGGLYSVQTVRDFLQIRLGISMAFLKNRFSHEAYAASLELRPSWTKLVWGRKPGNQIWCGLALPMQMRNLFINSWDEAHLYWLTTHSVAIAGEYHTRLPRLGYSVIRLDLPLFGLISRPPDYRYQKQEPMNHFSHHFNTPNRSLAFKCMWGYQSPLLQVIIRRVGKSALMNIGLELELSHCSEPKDIWILNTKLLFSYQWRIG